MAQGHRAWDQADMHVASTGGIPPCGAACGNPGYSGNPTGHSGEYRTAIKLAQRAAPKAVRRLIELMDSEDERVAAVACNSILDRAFGKPEVAEEKKDDYVAQIMAMTPQERLALAEEIIERGKKYLPLLAEARAKGILPPSPEEDEDDPTEGGQHETEMAFGAPVTRCVGPRRWRG